MLQLKSQAIPVSGEARTTRDRIATPFVKDTCDIIWYCLRMLRLMSLLGRWRWHGHQALKESLLPLSCEAGKTMLDQISRSPQPTPYSDISKIITHLWFVFLSGRLLWWSSRSHLPWWCQYRGTREARLKMFFTKMPFDWLVHEVIHITNSVHQWETHIHIFRFSIVQLNTTETITIMLYC